MDKLSDNLSIIDFVFSSHGRACSIYQTGSKAFTSLGHCLCGVGVVRVVSMDQVDLYVCDGEIISIT